MHFLVGSRAQLAPVWRAYGIAPIDATPAEAAAAARAYDRLQRPEPRPRPTSAATLRARGGRRRLPRQRPICSTAATRATDAGLDFEHSAYVMLIDKHGRQRVGIPFEQLTPRSLAADLKPLVAEP